MRKTNGNPSGPRNPEEDRKDGAGGCDDCSERDEEFDVRVVSCIAAGCGVEWSRGCMYVA